MAMVPMGWPGCLLRSAEHVVGVEDLDLVGNLDVAGGDDRRALLLDPDGVRLRGVRPDDDFLQVEDDVGHVLHHVRNRGELVQSTVDLHGGDGRALQGVQEHPAKRVAERRPERPLERLTGELPVVVGQGLLIDGDAPGLDEVPPVAGDELGLGAVRHESALLRRR